MKGRVKNVLLVLIALVILMQFYQPAVNKTVTTADNVDFITMYSPPADVAETLRMSCFDCHSNNTNYRWYDYIQPARTLVESHIQSAKKELNFDEWGTYSQRKQERLLMSIKSQIADKKMPLPSYTWIHKDAKLSNDEANRLLIWLKKL